LAAIGHWLKFSFNFNRFPSSEYKKYSPTINFKIVGAVSVAVIFHAAGLLSYSLFKKLLCSADGAKAFRCE
jgi:hypothetical protein